MMHQEEEQPAVRECWRKLRGPWAVLQRLPCSGTEDQTSAAPGTRRTQCQCPAVLAREDSSSLGAGGGCFSGLASLSHVIEPGLCWSLNCKRLFEITLLDILALL